MPDFNDELGQRGAWGMPFHGLVVAGTLTLANSQTKSFPLPSAPWQGSSFKLRVPGTVDVVRSQGEVAHDLVQGWTWKPDVINWLDGTRARIHGKHQLVNGRWLYAVAPGQCWEVVLPLPLQVAAEGGLVAPLTLRRYGELRETANQEQWTPETRAVSVALGGLTTADNNWLSLADQLWDVSASGDRAIIQYVSVGANLAPGARVGAVLLTLAGNGGAEPFSATLTVLHSANLPPNHSLSNTISRRWRTLAWQIDAEGVYDPDPASCPLTYTLTTSGGSRLIGEEQTSNPGGTTLSYYAGQMSSVLSEPLAFWLTEGGVEAITLDYRYTMDLSVTRSGSFSALEERVVVEQWEPGTGGCGLESTTVASVGLFQVDELQTRQMLETYEVVLRRGGLEVARHSLSYQTIQTHTIDNATFSGADLIAWGGVPPNLPSVEQTTVQRHYDGTLWESGSNTNEGTGMPNELGVPATYLSPAPHPPAGDDSDITLLRQITLYNLQNKRLQLAPHWYSNHLVCLTLSESPSPYSSLNWRTFGPSAYPGGINAQTFNVTGSALRYGSWNPVTNQVAVGNLSPVNWV